MASRPFVALALALALAVVAAAAGRPATAQDAPQDPLAAANALLDARERALVAGDRRAWLETVDPAAPEAFRDAQARQYDGLRRVALETFTLTARSDETGDLAPEPDAFLPETRMVYRLAGFDDVDAVETLWLTFVEREGRWFVRSDSEVADLGLDTARGIWDTGEVALTTTEHFLVLHHPPQAARAAAIGAIAEDAHDRLAAQWRRPWPGRIPIVLPGSVDELEELLQSTVDLDKFVAFVAYPGVRDTGWVAGAPRMYVQDENLSSYGRAFQVETLVHELAHAAAAPSAGPFVPGWLHEGVADWVATGRATGERRPPGSDGVLPRDHEFTTGSQSAILVAYRESRSVVATLAARGRGGRETPPALLEAVGRARVAPGSVDHRVDAALRETAGIGLADLVRLWGGR